jgi:2'-5' RNA ligase
VSGFWNERHEMDLETTTAEDVAARDVSRHLVLLARVDDAVAKAFQTSLDALDAFEGLAVPPERYLHVTVTLVGNVGPDCRLSPADEFRITDELYDALDGVEPFEVSFPKFDLFPSVVFASVDDGGAFAELNERACRVDGVEVHDRDEGFTPHLTLAQFRSQEGYDHVVSWLDEHRTLDVPSMRVDEVELVAVDLAARFPEFETVQRYTLEA